MSFGAAPGGGGMDEYQRLMAERNAAAKKKRMLFGLVAVAALGAVGYYVIEEPARRTRPRRQILDAGGRFAERDKMDMGAFWTCLMGTDTDVGMFQNADQIQQRVESAYFTQQKTYSEHLTAECVPKLEGRARRAERARERDARGAAAAAARSTSGRCPRCRRGWRATRRS